MSRSRSLLGAALALIAGAGLALAENAVRPAPGRIVQPGQARLGLGRAATPEEIAGWDIAVRPDGKGLPPGKGTVKQGEALYVERCASCHGEFGEGAGRWPILAGGAGSLGSDDPVKSVGSFWPYASTLFDYIRRAMPFGAAQSLTADETYALTAYVLYLNDVLKDEGAELSQANFPTLRLRNEGGFIADDRERTERHFWRRNPCMTNCGAGPARIVGRARALDVTPESGKGPKVE